MYACHGIAGHEAEKKDPVVSASEKIAGHQRSPGTVESQIFVRHFFSYFRTFEKSTKFYTVWKFILFWGPWIWM